MTQAATKSLPAQTRAKSGTAEARRIRRANNIPAVVYGHKEKNEDIAISHDDFWNIIRHNQRIVDVEVKGGKPQKCLVRDVQWDVLGKEVVHVDFERVSADERIHLNVPVKLKGTPIIPPGSVLNFHLHEVEIECSVINIPEAIVVNVAELKLGQAIHVRELQLPEGVKALSDADEVVVAIVVHVEKAEATPLEGAAVAEPEVLTARKPTDEEGEEGKDAKKK
ncbi:MAG: 50S ribosomal protein L25 [Gemmatales bacterium]